jgi:transcriptional regulator with XRE-family HTH domain
MGSLGKKIKALRQQKDWLQGDVAKKLNISIPAYSKIESDITDINISRLKQIADIFEVDVVELLSDNANLTNEYIDELKKTKETVESQEAKINKLQEYIIRLYEELHTLKQGVINT